MRGRVAGAALALAIMLVPAVLATGSAQAQTYSYKVLYSFTGTPDGAGPALYGTGLARDVKGNLYGTTGGGGTYGQGTVFKVDTKGKETVLYSFAGPPDGAGPNDSLVRDAQGNLYGTTQAGGSGSGIWGTVFKLDTAGKETVLHSFDFADGGQPIAGVVQDAQGNLYGTTIDGGLYDAGTVYEVDTTGKETVLYSFCVQGWPCPDGTGLYGGVVLDAQGNLYGTTASGGAYGQGTVFKLDTAGKETVLHSFSGTDGGGSEAGLVLDAQGNLYGTSTGGGASGYGTVFKVDTSNNLTVLYSFAGTPDGFSPVANVVRDAQGNLYGTTFDGGNSGCGAWNSCGTVFKLDTTGNETVLHRFTGLGGDGGNPGAGLALDAKGNLYGTTFDGGNIACQYYVYCFGTVFKLTPGKVTKTTTTLTSSPNPSTYGEPVTFTAVVAPAPPDEETVSFMKGKTVLGTGLLSSGTATFVTSTLKVGTTTVTAVYGGDSDFKASKSKPVKQVVEKAEE
jgi:uncharacterized repeat protein (TIGR03803 family)